MCDTKGHQHWCSGCGKNLNKEPKDSYIEIEWSQNNNGQIVEEKSMICKSCLEESENISELDKFFSELKYDPWGHVFCSCCKKDLTKELGKKIKSGIDYECLNFKCHEKSGPNIKHMIKVVVLCKDCVKTNFNAENLTKLKKLGKNPIFAPGIICDKIDICKQWSPSSKDVNCRNIVIGRDRESLQMAILCGKKHKGALLLPFDDGFSIIRPRKGKGAALTNPQAYVTGANPVQDYLKEIEKLFKRHKLGVYGDARLLAIETRLACVEKALGINNEIIPARICSIREEYHDTYPEKNISRSVDIDQVGSCNDIDIRDGIKNDVMNDVSCASDNDINIKDKRYVQRRQKRKSK